MYRKTTLALMLSLGLVATVHAKAEKQGVRMDGGAPVAEQIRRVEAAIGSEDYSEIGLEDKIGRASCRKECRSRWSPYH